MASRRVLQFLFLGVLVAAAAAISSELVSSRGVLQGNITVGTSSGLPGQMVLLYAPGESVRWVSRSGAVRLHCPVEARGGAIYNVTWRRDARNVKRLLPDADPSSANPDEFYVPAGAMTHGLEGNYTCLVRYATGAMLSDPVRLRIASFREFAKHPQNAKVIAGTWSTLSCRITSYPPAVITWIKNNDSVILDNRHTVIGNSTLFIRQTSVNDTGTYRCKAYNAALNKTRVSKPAKLTVRNATLLPAADVQILPENDDDDVEVARVIANAGADVRVVCHAVGMPVPTITWWKGDTNIGGKAMLVLANATINDSGVYSCKAENNNSATVKEYHVDVLQAPYFNVTPESTVFPPARRVRLECQALGNPEPDIYWLRNGDRIVYDSRFKRIKHQLVLSDSFTYDAGTYQCVARNSVGQQTSAAAQLTSRTSSTRPMPPANLSCRPYDAHAICVEWQQPRMGCENCTAYTLHIPEPSGDKLDPLVTNVSHRLVSGLRTNTTYAFYVRVYNSEASDDSEMVSCEVVKPAEAVRRLQFAVVNETQGAVLVRWSRLNYDVPCGSGGSGSKYMVRWRRKGDAFRNVQVPVMADHTELVGLHAEATYEFDVRPMSLSPVDGASAVIEPDTDINWVDYYVQGASTERKVPDGQFSGMSAVPDLLDTMQLQWRYIPENETALPDFYVFYTKGSLVNLLNPVKTNAVASNDSSVLYQRTTNSSMVVTNLEPNTYYAFRVGIPLGAKIFRYSHIIEAATFNIESYSIRGLGYVMVNSSSVCVSWEESQVMFEQNVNYFLKYSRAGERNSSLIRISSRSHDKSCWLTQGTLPSSTTVSPVIYANPARYKNHLSNSLPTPAATPSSPAVQSVPPHRLSIILTNLQANVTYSLTIQVLVRTHSAHRLLDHFAPLIFNTAEISSNDTNVADGDNTDIESTGQNNSGTSSNRDSAAVAPPEQRGSSGNGSSDDHEMQRLLLHNGSPAGAFAPTVGANAAVALNHHLDTKGGVGNGHHINITENPQCAHGKLLRKSLPAVVGAESSTAVKDHRLCNGNGISSSAAITNGSNPQHLLYDSDETASAAKDADAATLTSAVNRRQIPCLAPNG